MSPTTDDLRRMLDVRAAGLLTVDPDPVRAAVGSRLASVRGRVRRTRRTRALLVSTAVTAAAVVTMTVVPDLMAPDRSTRRPERPAVTETVSTVPALFEDDGTPPWADPSGRALAAATSIHSEGSREQSLSLVPTDDAEDAGFSVLVRCEGDPSTDVAWYVEGRFAGRVPCDAAGAGGAFIVRTAALWTAWGLVPGLPATLVVRFVDEPSRPWVPDGLTTQVDLPVASAVLGIYGEVGARVPERSTLDAEAGGRRLLADVRIPGSYRVTTRALRVTPVTLDALAVDGQCYVASPGAGFTVDLAVNGTVFARRVCSPDGLMNLTGWPGPSTDGASYWTDAGIVPGEVLTLVVLVRSNTHVRGGPAPRVATRERDIVDVGVYGVG